MFVARMNFTVLLASLSLLAVASTSSALAQTTPSDTLQAVRVTVLRTPFDLTTAPMNVATVGTRDIATARPGFSLDEALGQVAGIQVDNRLNFAVGERISVRGIGARSQFGTRGVRLIVDGIPATLADGQSALNNIDLGSLGLAEAIRGPASALYGNASAGVISFLTLPPPNVPFAPTARVMAGSDGLSRVQLGAGGIKGSGTYVVNADRFDYSGYRDYSRARNTHLNSVGTWDWARMSLKLVANSVQYTAENPGSLSDSLIGVDRHQAYSNNLKQQTGEHGRQTQLGLSARAAFGVGELRVSVYGLARSINNPIPPRIIGIHRAASGARIAYSVTGGTAERGITAIIGGESDLQRDDRRNWINLKGIAGALALDQRERVTSTSPFVQVSAVAGRATFLGGVRYDQFRFAVVDHLNSQSNPDGSGIRKMYATSPTLGASYALSPSIVVYSNVSTGFQTPTTTELANRPSGAGGFNPLLQPERTHSHEGGVKGRSRFVSYDLALYDMRIDNELIPFEVASSPGRQFFRNVGTARHRGVDFDATAELARLVRLHGSYSITDARYVTYAVVTGNRTTSFATDRVPGIAPNMASLSLQLGDPSSRFVSMEERYRSSIPVNDANSASSRRYFVTNLRGVVRAGGVSLFGGVGNLFGALYNTSVSVNALGGRYFDPAAGRSMYAGVDLLGFGK